MERLVLLFRIFIVGSVVFGICGAVVDVVFPSLLPDILEDSWEAYTLADEAWSFIAIAGGLAILLLMSGVVATIGLLMLKRWARPLALWLTVLSVVTYPLFGAMLQSAWALILTETGTLLWGGALAMAYFSDLRVEFQP